MTESIFMQKRNNSNNNKTNKQTKNPTNNKRFNPSLLNVCPNLVLFSLYPYITEKLPKGKAPQGRIRDIFCLALSQCGEQSFMVEILRSSRIVFMFQAKVCELPSLPNASTVNAGCVHSLSY